MIGFGLVAMLAISPELTLVTFAVSPYLAYVSFRFDRQIRPTFSRIRKALSDLTTTIQETISGVRTVKSFAREGYEIEKYPGSQPRLHGPQPGRLEPVGPLLPASWRWAATWPRPCCSGTAAAWSSAATSAWGVWWPSFSLVGYMVWPIRELGWVLNLYSQSVAAGERLIEVLHAPETVTNREGAVALGQGPGPRPLRERVLRFDGRHMVLRGIDVDAPPGSTIALIGTTGAGKTSLVSLIPRFYDVSAGRVLVDGHDVRDLELESLRSNVGFVLQETFLFSATIRENIAYGRPDASRRRSSRRPGAPRPTTSSWRCPGLRHGGGRAGVGLAAARSNGSPLPGRWSSTRPS